MTAVIKTAVIKIAENLLWFTAHSSHVYISITNNSVENTTLKVYKLQLGVYVSVN